MNTVKIEAQISEHISAIRQSAGETVPIDMIPGILLKLLRGAGNEQESDMNILRGEIDALREFIINARKEISGIRPKALREVEIPEATDELDAVVMATEEATNAILDCAEKLQTICGGLTGPESDTMQTLVEKIYEASNFQDITGQRISKVVDTLQNIELRVTRLAAIFPGANDEEGAESGRGGSLLNGPQLPAAANRQDDIDALFDNL